MSLVHSAVRPARALRSLTTALTPEVVTDVAGTLTGVARRATPMAALAGAAAVGAVGTLARAAWGLPTALGASRADIARVAAGSARYRDGAFRNTQPASSAGPPHPGELLLDMITRGTLGRPAGPVPLAVPAFPSVADPIAVTWFGHSTALIEIDGRRVLVDPVWSERVSPSPVLGPRRMHPAPARLDTLPPLDAVLISHDHYDHLDLATVRALAAHGSAPFVVPLGVGAHLRAWGVPAERVLELDWGDQVKVRELTLSCTEARHFSGRGPARDGTLWSSWVIAGPQHGVFFGGDTGYFPGFAEIGARFGPFNLTLLPVGAYHAQWPDIHMTPEQAVRAHGDLGGGLLVPIHWATFNLAFHGWGEPVRRLLAEASRTGARVAVPRPGERFAAAAPPEVDWWSGLDGTPVRDTR